MSELIQAKKPNLGFGNMRMPVKEDGSVDIDTIFKMVDTYMAHGFNYYDTGYVYKGSEEMLRRALVERYPRDSFMITTKMFVGDCKTKDDMMKQFNISKERLGLDVIDTYFLHAVGPMSYKKHDELKSFDFLRGLKDKGLVKHIGFSFHGSADELDGILTANPDMELVQLQLNYLDWEDEKVQSRRCYETARNHNIPISVMEPCKGGWLAGNDTDAARLLLKANPDVSVASWAFRFIAGLEGIFVILSGMSNVEQVEDNAKTFENFTPLTPQERELTLKVVEMINATPSVPCTGCGYCSRGCPQNLPIPMYMSAYNALLRFNNLESSRHNYKMATNPQNIASNCIGCKSCEERCPQQIEITKYIKEIAEKLD